ncbi:Aminopeptidase 2 mitochondrial [Coemansia sp. RSA 2322]|nr:Aminopeptidase 2 mitochondrial [Coemansia sp. RSA 2322]
MALKPDTSAAHGSKVTPPVSAPASGVTTPGTQVATKELTTTQLVVPWAAACDGSSVPENLVDEERSSSSVIVTGAENSSDVDRLPATIRPTHYDIHLGPDLETGKVAGSVAVDAVVDVATDRVVLHAKHVAIARVAVYRQGAQVAVVVGEGAVEYDGELEMATVRLPVELQPGPVQLIIGFEGVLSASMYGLYRSRYRNRAGQASEMLVTQFQAKCARMAFPCWDEPAIKAEFSLAITVPASHTTLSNMPVESATESNGGLKTVRFMRSPRMSTYLLAVVSGELEYVEAQARAGAVISGSTEEGEQRRELVPCRVYTAAADVGKVAFSLATAVRVLERLVLMFDSAYPLPKLDLVAVPELEAGGMENWGLVLFRTVRLFITAQTSLWIRQKAVYVIAHELSHQWFGNLGFATWIGIHVTDLLYPEWRRWDHFAVEDRQAALSADSLRSSHAVQVPIKGSADIDQVFDSITYYKGCALIRMLSAHVGTDAFMAGVRAYLRAHAYASATTRDLWAALEKASGQAVAALMHSWTTRPGYPVVAVDADFARGTMRLAQSRFLHSGRAAASEDRVVWWVPLGIVGPDGVGTAAVLHERAAAVAIPPGAEWIKLNHASAGLYRVCYSRDALRRLAKAATEEPPPPRGRGLRAADAVGVLGDAVALALSGHVRTSAVLELVAPFAARAEFAVWQTLGLFLETLHATWADRCSAELLERIRGLARSLFAPLAAALGWAHRTGDGPLVERLRATAIARAAWAGDARVIEDANALFARFYAHPQEPKPFHHDFTAAVLEIAVRCGPPANHARVRDMYENSARWRLSEDHRMAALGALACAPSADCLYETLDYALSDRVLPQDLAIVMGFMVSADHRSKHVLWRWFKLNYARVVARLGDASPLLGHVVTTVVGYFSSEDLAADVDAWFRDKCTAAFDRTLPQALEFIRARAAWFDRDCDDVEQWFAGNPGV